MLHFSVETTVLDGGERVPALWRLAPYGPVVSVLLYVTIRRRRHPTNTIKLDVRVIGWFFDWWIHRSLDDLDDLLRQGELIEPWQIADFAHWLETRSARKGAAQDIDSARRPITLNNYLSALHSFLKWTVARYSRKSERGKPLLFDKAGALSEIFRSVRIRGRTPEEDQVLNAEQCKQLYALTEPSNEANPFRPSLRLRNALILRLLHQTGLRRGELLKLKTTDFLEDDEGRVYLVVVMRQGDPLDSRRAEPGQKTRERRLAITQSLHQLLLAYVKTSRRPIRDGRPAKLAHSYLLVSERGHPLAESQINYILNRIASAASVQNQHLHPHLLRRTFCVEAMDYFVDELGLDETAAKDRLREYCGWSAASVMPERYTRNRIRREANAANLRRLHAAENS